MKKEYRKVVLIVIFVLLGSINFNTIGMKIEKPSASTGNLSIIDLQNKCTDKIGYYATFNNWECQIANVLVKTEIHKKSLRCTPKGKYIISIGLFTNNTSKSREIGANFIAIDEKGRLYKLDKNASIAYSLEESYNCWYNKPINHLETTYVPLAFDISKDAKRITIYTDSTFKTPIYFVETDKITKHDYSKQAHLPASGWNPFTASDDEIKYYRYPKRPTDPDKLSKWKTAVCGGWFQDGKYLLHSHACIPCEIVWNGNVYTVSSMCGPLYGNQIESCDLEYKVYEIPGVNTSYGIILGYGTLDGHRATKIDYSSEDALKMIFTSGSSLKESIGNLNFPRYPLKITSSIKLKNKKSTKNIPIELETKIEASRNFVYTITLTESWNTSDYNSGNHSASISSHYWRFKVMPSAMSLINEGGDTRPN